MPLIQKTSKRLKCLGNTAFISIFFFVLFTFSNRGILLAQGLSTSDSIVYQAIVENNLVTLKAQLKANNDTFGLPYLQGVMLALNGPTQQAINLLLKAATDSTSPYRDVASMELLKVYANAGQYKQYCQFDEQAHRQSGRYEDARLFATYPPTQINFVNPRDRIPFQLRRKSYVVVRMEVNGRPTRFILDTGCSQTIITNQLAQALGLTVTRTGTAVLTATNQLLAGGSTLLDRVQLGNLTVSNLPVKSYPRIFGFFASLRVGRIDGLIGLDILKHLRYTIHFEQHYCLLEKPVVTPASKPKNLFACNEALLYQFTRDGKPFYLFYDSGSNDFNLTRFARNKVMGYRSRFVKHRTYGLNGSHLLERVNQIKNFSFHSGSYLVRVPKVTFTQREYWVMNVPVAGIIGNKPFRKGVVCVDFPNGQFSYTE